MARRLALHRTLLIGLIAFVTLVDLFATQAILPSLAARYEAGPAEMGTAVNATTFGMAVAALGHVTGNVASNLVGRLGAAALVDHVGLAESFLGFALLNLAGAALVHATIDRVAPTDGGTGVGWRAHLRNPTLLICLAIGFCILFAFVGTFTYVNFVLVGPPFGFTPMQLGLVCLVFLRRLRRRRSRAVSLAGSGRGRR